MRGDLVEAAAAAPVNETDEEYADLFARLSERRAREEAERAAQRAEQARCPHQFVYYREVRRRDDPGEPLRPWTVFVCQRCLALRSLRSPE